MRLATCLRAPAPTLLALTLALSLSGCVNLAPTYEQPAAPVPGNWSGIAVSGNVSGTTNATAADSLDWRSFFQDERLRQVIAQALANNRDLRVAALNVQYARAQYRITDANRYPALSASASSTASRTPAVRPATPWVACSNRVVVPGVLHHPSICRSLMPAAIVPVWMLPRLPATSM